MSYINLSLTYIWRPAALSKAGGLLGKATGTGYRTGCCTPKTAVVLRYGSKPGGNVGSSDTGNVVLIELLEPHTQLQLISLFEFC